MVQHIQTETSLAASIQNIQSRINNICSKIDKLDQASWINSNDFRSILLDNLENNVIGSNLNGSYGNLKDLYGTDKNYFADYIINNLTQVSNIANINSEENIGSSSSVECQNQDKENESNKILSGIDDLNLYEGIVSLTKKMGEQFGVDPNLINAIIKIESNFNPLAFSKAGAMGLMQLMPATAESLGVEDPYDIYQNLTGGTKLIKGLIDSFNGDIKLALAAYNAGSARVRECGDVPQIEETQNFVAKVLSIYNSDSEIL
jgi:hypothetical protein